MNIVVVGHYRESYALGYYLDWRDAFLELQPRHTVRVINTWSRLERPRPIMEALPLSWSFDIRPFEDLYSGRTACDLVVYAPSFFYFNQGRRRDAILRAAEKATGRIPTAFFVENEYRQLAEKVDYALALGARFLITQVAAEVGVAFYRQRFGGKILSLPPGLNSAVFHPTTPIAARPIHVGTRSHRYPRGPIGDRRNALLDFFERAEGPLEGLAIDVSTRDGARFTRTDWAAFLNRCRGTVATEAAGQLRWNDAEDGLSFGVVSSRHYEAIGTKTALLMPPGGFGGRLQAGLHYLEIDLDRPTTLVEAARFVKDPGALEEQATRALDSIKDSDTYRARCLALLAEI